MAGLLAADTVRLLERLASAECDDVEAALTSTADVEASEPPPLADSLAAMPYPLLAIDAASVRVYCGCLVRSGPAKVPRLLGCLRARLASLAALDRLAGGDASLLDVLGLATLTRCTLEQLVREPPRSVREWDAALAPPAGAAGATPAPGAGLSYAVDSLLEFVTQCAVDVDDARYYVLAEVLSALLLLATARADPPQGRRIFDRALLGSSYAVLASQRLLAHVVSRDAGTAPAAPSTLFRKISSLASALLSVPSSLFAMVGGASVEGAAGSAAASSDELDAIAGDTAAMAAAATAAATAATAAESLVRGDYNSDDTTTLPPVQPVDLVAERALALLLLLSQCERNLLPEPEPEPEPEPGENTGNMYLASLSGDASVYGRVYTRVGSWLADPRGAVWAYMLVTREPPELLQLDQHGVDSSHGDFREWLLARTDLDVWLLPLLEQLYALSEPPPTTAIVEEAPATGVPAAAANARGGNSGSAGVSDDERHRIVGTEILLLTLLELSCDSTATGGGGSCWCEAIHGVVLDSGGGAGGGSGQQIPIPSWFRAQQIKQQLTVGSLLVMIVCRAITRNLGLVAPPRSRRGQAHPGGGGTFARTHGQFLLRSALALLQNLAPHLRDVHAIAADRLVRTYLMLLKRLTVAATATAAAAETQRAHEDANEVNALQQREGAAEAEELLSMAAGLFDGLFLNDGAMRRNAELMYALLRSKDALETQLAATGSDRRYGGAVAATAVAATAGERQDVDRGGTGAPRAESRDVDVEPVAVAVAVVVTEAEAAAEAGAKVRQQPLENLRRVLRVFDDAATQATATAAAMAAATALGGGGRAATTAPAAAADKGSQPGAEQVLEQQQQGGGQTVGSAGSAGPTGANAAATGANAAAAAASAMLSVKDLMETCVADTAATWRGAEHHGLQAPLATPPWRYRQSSACAAAFLTPYLWQLTRRLTREPAVPGSAGGGGASSGSSGGLGGGVAPSWATIPD
eukprot:COSAG06_NODE_688_length_13072_cov_15.012719_11_plen_982_part_00